MKMLDSEQTTNLQLLRRLPEYLDDPKDYNWLRISRKNSKLRFPYFPRVSGVLCSSNCQRQEYMDFSAVVLPMMKSLEHELRIRFCDKYIEYLKREYPTLEDFTTANNIYKKPGGVRKDKKVLFIKDEISGDTIYADGSIAYEQFSLGSFKYTLSKVDRDIEELEKAIELDHTAIEFCNQSLFKNYISDEDTREWLTKLICEVETLIKRRNDSAHGGNVLDEMSAQSTWRDLITIQKVLVSLVERCQ